MFNFSAGISPHATLHPDSGGEVSIGLFLLLHLEFFTI